MLRQHDEFASEGVLGDALDSAPRRLRVVDDAGDEELQKLPTRELEERLVALASEIFAAEARFLRLLAEFDRRQDWGVGVLSAAHWLSWRCGIDLSTARERVRVARALHQLPSVTEAFEAGALSYSKVRAITRVGVPQNEHRLLELARAGTASQLERIVRGYRANLAEDARNRERAGAPPVVADEVRGVAPAAVGSAVVDPGSAAPNPAPIPGTVGADEVGAGELPEHLRPRTWRRWRDDGMVERVLLLTADQDALLSATLRAAVDLELAEDEPDDTSSATANASSATARTSSATPDTASPAERPSVSSSPSASSSAASSPAPSSPSSSPAQPSQTSSPLVSSHASSPGGGSPGADASEGCGDAFGGSRHGDVRAATGWGRDREADLRRAEWRRRLLQRPQGEREVEAFLAVAESFLAHPERHERIAGDRYQVGILVELDELRRGLERDPLARCADELGEPIPAEVARRLACDCSTRTLVEGRHGEVLDVGRTTRAIPRAIRRALLARDGGCTFPGCDNRRWVDAHHIIHWADGGPTVLSNLVLLCRRHHTAVHENGVRITLEGSGARPVFSTADGRLIEACPSLPRASGGFDGWFGPAGLRSTELTAADGGRGDIGLAVACLGEADQHEPAAGGESWSG